MLTMITASIALVICGLISYVIWFYKRLANYPPGPTPLPFIGNILLFIRLKHPWNWEIIKLSKVYGPVMTVWIGTKPLVFICDLQLGREAFNGFDCSDRPKDNIGDTFSNERYKDIIFSNGKSWESLRKVGLRAIRTFANSETVLPIVAENVKHGVDVMNAREGKDRPFSPDKYVYSMLANTIGAIVFSHKFNIEDEGYKCLKYIGTDFQSDVGVWMFLYDFVPIIRPFISNPLNKYRQCFDKAIEFSQNIYTKHLKTYETNSKRDFCDVLIGVKHRAIEEEKASEVDLTDLNLAIVLIDLYIGGVETSYTTWKWMLLFMSHYQEVQKKLREEIDSVLGDRMPTQGDMNQMPYTMAFICETLRLRSPLPTGLLHWTSVDTRIGCYPVPQNTILMVQQQSIMFNDNHWTQPHEFNPNRFMAPNGKQNVHFSAFCPFGVGRRICPGEKLAMVDLFLTLVTFLQLTHECDIHLHSEYTGAALFEPETTYPQTQFPKPFMISLSTRQK